MDLGSHQASPNGSDSEQKYDGAPLSAVYSASSSGSRGNTSSRLAGRAPSTHTLLAATNSDILRRKPHTETDKTSVDRPSVSMPPPSTKPMVDRSLSQSVSTMRPFRPSNEGPASPPSSVRSMDERTSIDATTPQAPTTATETIHVTTASNTSPQMPGLPVLSPPALPPDVPNQLDTAGAQIQNKVTSPKREPSTTPTALQDTNGNLKTEAMSEGKALPARIPRASDTRSISTHRRLSTPSQKSVESEEKSKKLHIGTIGVCAMDSKARSKPSRQILTRLQEDGEFEVVIFGDKAINDEDVANWPICDFLIAFYSEGFPLDKAIEYVKLRKPFVVNDLSMQKVLWDRRLCLLILDQMKVPTPKRIEVNRDGGSKLESVELARHVKRVSGVVLEGTANGTGGGEPLTKTVAMVDDGDTLIVDGKPFKKPFVEKPVDGDDHNVIIYFPRSHEGGGARRLFRKIGNKSSEFDPELITPRCITDPTNSYIYEQFLKTENAEDVKSYTIGEAYCHAETRKSPVVDGVVKRNTHGKELRYVTELTRNEKEMAARVSRGFGQRICGFDLLRAGGQSYVVDVNGWSFVKDNEKYYNECATILKSMFSKHKFGQDSAVDDAASETGIEPPSRRETGSSTSYAHRNALKTIFKSPSISRLSQHLPHPHHGKHHGPGAASPIKSSTTVPMSSPASMERGPGVYVPPPPLKAYDSEDTLPPPMIPPAMSPEPSKSEAALATTEGEGEAEPAAPLPNSKHSWKLKGVVTVIRHADRTPKQKLKFTAHSPVFVDLLKGHHEEVLLKGEAALASVEAAAKIAQQQGIEDLDKLKNLRNALAKKKSQPATKVQIKPMFRKKKPEEMNGAAEAPTARHLSEISIPEHAEARIPQSPTSVTNSPTMNNEIKKVPTRSDSISGATFSRYAAAENDLILDKMQLVMKWGGEPTHSARYQSQDLGQNMRDDFKLLNRKVLDDVRIYTSSEKRVRTTAQIWAGGFLGRDDLPEDDIRVRKDLLDDSNAAKDVMDKVKKKLKHLLREGNSVPEEFAWPKDVPEPYVVMMAIVDLLKFHRKVMRHNFKKLSSGAQQSLAAIGNPAESGAKEVTEPLKPASIQSRWCTGEDAELFKERWEKLFAEFCEHEKVDPSKVSELYDTMKYDALHNKQFLEWVFTPSQSIIDEIQKEESATKEESAVAASTSALPDREAQEEPIKPAGRHDSTKSTYMDRSSFAERIGLRRRSMLINPATTPPLTSYEQDASYFKLFSGSGDGKLKQDKRLGRLRELYRYAKILFDYIGPQEYGISDHEKLEIGLLTSLPLLREIVQDLEELQASGAAKSFVYFTKESHIYTLLNCIMEGGIHTKIKRATIPELDYLSQICFELYEATDADTKLSDYSIRISISPGCHTIDPLDVSLDSKHAIGSAPRRTLTDHQDWKEVITSLKNKFDTVQLPQSFLAVNVSDKHEQDAEGAGGFLQEDDGQMNTVRGREPVSFVNGEDA